THDDVERGVFLAVERRLSKRNAVAARGIAAKRSKPCNLAGGAHLVIVALLHPFEQCRAAVDSAFDGYVPQAKEHAEHVDLAVINAVRQLAVGHLRPRIASQGGKE